jgi:hypothetical protein
VRISIYLCLLGSPLLALLGCQLRHHLPPAAAVKTMTALALGAATATVWGLVLLAGAGLGRTGEAAMLLDTNPVAADTTDPVPRWFGAAAVLLLAVAAARTARVLWVRHTVTRLGARVGGPAPPGPPVVFTAIEPHAYGRARRRHRTRSAQRHSAIARCCNEFRGIDGRCVDSKEDHVHEHLIRLNGDAGDSGETFDEALSVLVVFDQAVAVAQRHDSGRG